MLGWVCSGFTAKAKSKRLPPVFEIVEWKTYLYDAYAPPEQPQTIVAIVEL